MKNYARVALCLISLGFLAVGLVQAQITRPGDLAKAGDMLAGNPKNGIMDVGDIYVWKDCKNIYVEYVIVDSTPGNVLDNWYLTATQVEVKGNPNLIPQKNGNPIPGQFTYKMGHDYIPGYIQAIPLNSTLNGLVAIAAHADVCKGGLDGLANALPEYLEVCLSLNYLPRLAYFSIVEVKQDTWLNGTYINQGWCVDREHYIDSSETAPCYPAKVYSSYDLPLPLGPSGDDLIDKPENLDMVNWLLNQNFVGKMCPDFGEINWVDVQVAVWKLLDDEEGWPTTWDPYDQNRVQYLLNLAAQHDGYVPGCKEKLWVVVAPHTGDVQNQTIIIPVPVPCESCETAWAAHVTGSNYAYMFTGKNWATYLLLTPPYYPCN